MTTPAVKQSTTGILLELNRKAMMTPSTVVMTNPAAPRNIKNLRGVALPVSLPDKV
jgi:hypothetical protein